MNEDPPTLASAYVLILAFDAGVITSTRTFVRMRLAFEQPVTYLDARQQLLAVLGDTNIAYKLLRIS
jgi:hypothetical protein